MSNTLHLTLKKSAFDVMITGEKTKEFRKPSKWIISRLVDNNGNPKTYDNVKFVNGYGHDKPTFLADYKGFRIAEQETYIKYSNGLTVVVEKGDYIIMLGSVFYKSNKQ